MPKWRSGSIFGPGVRVALDREQKAQLRAKITLQRRPGRLTIAAAHVARTLLSMAGPDGRLDPSHEYLAAKAAVSIATCKRALSQLKAFGFLRWTRRLVRNAATGWRCEQTSSAYALCVPCCDAHSAREVLSEKIKKTLSAPSFAPVFTIAEELEARAALAQRCAVISERLLMKKA
jgi:hypothetical protein